MKYEMLRRAAGAVSGREDRLLRILAGHDLPVVTTLAAFLSRRRNDPDTPPPADRWWSQRRLDVVRLLAEGLTYAEIAHILGISAETVKNHVTQILRHMDARSSLHAVAIAARTGLLDGGV